MPKKIRRASDQITRRVKNRDIHKRVAPIPRPTPTARRPTQKGVRDFTQCPRCHAETVPTLAYSGEESQFWRECTACNTFINTYIPQKHQQAFHTDSHRFKGNFGGYGSGKTTTTRMELYKHLFLTPRGTGLIGANISAQYEQTIKRDIEADFPVALIKDVSVQKAFTEFINGYRLMYRPFDDAGKLRSLNLDFLAIIEGSEVDPQIFTIGKTRLRNVAASKQLEVDGKPQFIFSEQGVPIPLLEHDWRQIVIESNPDAGWVKNDVVNVSDKVYINGPVLGNFDIMEVDKDEATSSHVTDTSCNQFLPTTYMRDVAKNRPQWWVNRYLHGSFDYSEGLVYPAALNNARTKKAHVVTTYEVPKHWKRILAFDYGLADAAGVLWGAIDEDNSKLVIYREWKETNRNVAELAEIIKSGSADTPAGGWLRPFIIDPKSGVKRDYNKKSLIDHFLDYGVAFEPGQISVDARVFKLNTYFEQDYVEIMDCCPELIKELKNYKFPSDLRKESGRADKPEDQNNHLINPLEWIVMELPANPADILYGIYSAQGKNLLAEAKQDEEDYYKHLFTTATEPGTFAPPPTDATDIPFFGGGIGSYYGGGLFNVDD